MNRIKLIKLLSLVLISCTMLFTTSCVPDDSGSGIDFVELHHDGSNVDAPFLPAGTYQSGVRFPASFTGNDDGNLLTEVDYFIKKLPDNAVLKIYDGGESIPSSILRDIEVTSEMVTGWNTHTLSEPVRLSGSDLWITVEYTTSIDDQTIGCDLGPAKDDGNWFYDAAVGDWLSLFSATNGDNNINWNIRGQVEIVL